jgi:putative membrane protein insertion efficiency factor
VSSRIASDASPPRPGPLARVLLLAIEAYRALLSPLVGGHCRFWPSCSVYAEQAIRKHGALRGLRLALFRLLRCQPFSRGGVDPVP